MLKGRTDSAVKNRFYVLQRNTLKDDDASTTSSITIVQQSYQAKTKRSYPFEFLDTPSKFERNDWDSVPSTDGSIYSTETDCTSDIDCYSEISSNFDPIEQDILDLLASDMDGLQFHIGIM